MALQANYSFSGALHPLSKLIICLVMLRGRHRGLPVAIDRAVMLPFEFRDDYQDTLDESYADDFGDNMTSQSSDNNSQHHLDDLDGRPRTIDPLDTQAQIRPEGLFDQERSPVRDRDAAPKRVSIQADTLRDPESRMQNVVDEQTRRGGLTS